MSAPRIHLANQKQRVWVGVVSRRWFVTALPGLGALLALAVGALLALSPETAAWAPTAWRTGLVLTGPAVLWRTLRGMLAGRFAADLVAALAIVAAIPLGQALAGLVVVVMQTGGESVERFAEGRASAAVRELEAAAPRIAHRVLDGAGEEDVPVDEVAVGDRLLVRPGEMIPCDADVTGGYSHVDVSRITGEPIPVSARPGTRLLSGSLNGESPLTLRAVAPASGSQYARIVELVRSAQGSKAPLQRLADRYAVWFTPLTLAVCAAAWLVSGDATRVLAVLVVATPCPLILATPVAILGGINRAARRQIIVRNGTALERLGAVTAAVFDKTGTLTIGRPAVSRVVALNGFDERALLRLAAAVEQGSGHQLARPVVEAARGAGLELPAARAVREAAGRGVTGEVDGRIVAVGSRSFIRDDVGASEGELAGHIEAGRGLRALVAVGGAVVGAIEYADRLRAELAGAIAHLRRLGVRRILIVSGDHLPNARAVGDAAGIAEVHGDLLPEQKVEIVRRLVAAGEVVLMAGDGTNDAPALGAAHVGVALAGHGGGIVAEAADVIVLADDLTRIGEAIGIGRRTMRIARQSIGVGLGLSGVAMAFAALGAVPPVAGAVLQEAIDLAVIFNALRASR